MRCGEEVDLKMDSEVKEGARARVVVVVVEDGGGGPIER